MPITTVFAAEIQYLQILGEQASSMRNGPATR